MNDKFFDLKKEKQDRFINAALKLFGENGYKKASTDDIVKEAGVSKGLLFHYFGNKQGLYEFVYEYSRKYIRMEYEAVLSSYQVDFFELQRSIEMAKKNIMRTYPCMNVFMTNAFREDDKEILPLVTESMDAYSDYLASVYARADVRHFKEGIDPSAVLKMCLFVADGVLGEQFRNGKMDPDGYYEEVDSYLTLLHDQFCVL